MSKQYDFNAISQLLLPHIENILQLHNIPYTIYWNRISLSCPLHGSDKKESLCIFTKQSYKGLIGNWCCYTNNCHIEYGRSLLGFIRGLLSSKEKRSIHDTIEWCKRYIDGNLEDYRIDINKQNFIQISNTVNAYSTYKFQIDREFFRERIIIPPDYYLNKGYERYLLDKYDVGICNDQSKPFYLRYLVPLYDNKHSKIVAVLARSPYNKCNICDNFHSPEKCNDNPKWLNAGYTGNILYNYWFSKNHIRNNGEIIIVEGCGDVWKLEQAGIYNSVALCSNKLTYQQQLILEKSGATKVILALDSDEKGQEGKEQIKKKLWRLFSIDEIIPPEKDIGDMNINDIRKLFNKK